MNAPIDIARKDLQDGDLLTITPRVRFALWVTEVLPGVTRHWSVCPAELDGDGHGDGRGEGRKVTVTQHGAHSYTVTVYARDEAKAYDEAMAAIARQERLYGVADNLNALRMQGLLGEGKHASAGEE
jgi:hypothetical protein